VARPARIPGVAWALAAPFALFEPGRLEALVQPAGLTPIHTAEVACPFEYPDGETAWRAMSSAGPFVAANRSAGEQRVRQAVEAALPPTGPAAAGCGWRTRSVTCWRA
jgi:hypothetical protein